MPKQYKIGEFSKYLGVTPDFLKHYEQYGLIEPTSKESNYRYYSFIKAAEAIECIRYKNWGFPLKEMKTLIHESNIDEIMNSYQKKVDELQKTIRFYQILIDEFKEFETWLTKSNHHWIVQYVDEALFLPHSNNYDFLQNQDIYPIMEQWTKWMPAVHSCQRIYDCFDEQKEPYCHWGFSIRKTAADEIGLIQSAPCELIPRRKCFVIHDSIDNARENSKIDVTLKKVHELLAEHHFTPEGEIHRVIYQYSHEDGKITQHSSLFVPIKE